MDKLGDEVRRELGRFGPQAGMAELVERWPAVVGEPIARFAWPARIARDGTVHVHTADSVWAFELGHRSVEIASRLGVATIRFAPGPLPEAMPEQVVEALEPTPEDDARARELAAPIADEKLRESVQKAVRLSLARGRLDRPF
jgi:Dna[CI] antecedent DciA-like protein